MQSSVSSIQRYPEPSTDSTGILGLGQCKHKETTMGPLPRVKEDVRSSKSVLLTLGSLPSSPQEPGRHSFFYSRRCRNIPICSRESSIFAINPGGLTHSILAQAMTHHSGPAEGALLHSAFSPAESEANEYSPSF